MITKYCIVCKSPVTRAAEGVSRGVLLGVSIFDSLVKEVSSLRSSIRFAASRGAACSMPSTANAAGTNSETLLDTLVVPRVPMSRSRGLGGLSSGYVSIGDGLGISPSHPHVKESHEWMLYENERMWLPSQAACARSVGWDQLTNQLLIAASRLSVIRQLDWSLSSDEDPKTHEWWNSAMLLVVLKDLEL